MTVHELTLEAGTYQRPLDHTPRPWLYLRCTCGWFRGYGSNYSPAGMAAEADEHAKQVTA